MMDMHKLADGSVGVASAPERGPKDPVAIALGLLMGARAALDASIDVLSRTHELQKKPEVPMPVKDAQGNCLHTHRKPLATMGDEAPMELCTDCDAIIPTAA